MSEPVKPESTFVPPASGRSLRLLPALLLALGVGFAGLVAGGIAGFILGSLSSRTANPFMQSGTFQTIQGTQGVVNYPIPYRSPPNVALSGDAKGAVIITECTKEGFTWKNAGGTEFWNKGAVQWTAQGIR